jgi:hypothetical protein
MDNRICPLCGTIRRLAGMTVYQRKDTQMFQCRNPQCEDYNKRTYKLIKGEDIKL